MKRIEDYFNNLKLDKNIGRRLEMVRHELNYTRMQMANFLSVSQSTYSRYESSSISSKKQIFLPSIEAIIFLCFEKKINPMWLIFGLQDMHFNFNEKPEDAFIRLTHERMKTEIAIFKQKLLVEKIENKQYMSFEDHISELTEIRANIEITN